MFIQIIQGKCRKQDEMRALKREHLGIDEATDVLSFPIDGRDELQGCDRQHGRGLAVAQNPGCKHEPEADRKIDPTDRPRRFPPCNNRERGSDGSEEWTRVFERPDSDLFLVQDEIARSAAARIIGSLPVERPPRSRSIRPEAYRDLLQQCAMLLLPLKLSIAVKLELIALNAVSEKMMSENIAIVSPVRKRFDSG